MLEKLVEGKKVYFDLNILGNPVPLARCRYADGKVYQPKRNRDSMKVIQWKLRQHISTPIDTPVGIYLEFARQWPEKKRNTNRQSTSPDSDWQSTRPDIDNYIKLVFDALTSIAVTDDSRICEIFARKEYSDNARTRIVLYSLA